MVSGFLYDGHHCVVVCEDCKTCLAPTATGIYRHLRRAPHRLTGDVLKATACALLGYELRTVEELRRQKPRTPCKPVKGLETYAGRRCLCDDKCDYSTTWVPSMDAHVGAAKHRRKAKEHKTHPLWEECTLQSYFTAKGMIDYFVVAAPVAAITNTGTVSRCGITAENIDQQPSAARSSTPATDSALFGVLRGDIANAERELEEKGGIVQGVEGSRTERVPWLARTGFYSHLHGLRDEEIKLSYTLPPKKVLDAYGRAEPLGADADGDSTLDLDLVRILVAAEAMLREAYELCSDKSPARKMTQMRANILNEFYDGSRGKANGFRYFKNESTLSKYFKRMKEMLAYYYNVVYREGPFTRDQPDQALPADVIEASTTQKRAMKGIIDILRRQDRNTKAVTLDENAAAAPELKHAIRRLYMALICHTVGSKPFRSPVLSFCAMLSRKVYKDKSKSTGRSNPAASSRAPYTQGVEKKDDQQEGGGGQARQRPARQGIWREPNEFNSDLSALTWCAQLVLFDYACFDKQENENQIPDLLQDLVRRFLQQHRETPFGHVLQWRLYLFATSSSMVATKQARWSIDGQAVTYNGLELYMDQVSQLIESEFRQASSLLFEELLLGARDLPVIESWKLRDDLDRDEFGASWLDDPRNAELLQGSQEALLRRIWSSDVHRRMFLGEGPDERTSLCAKAMALYEVYVQEFMERLSNLMIISPGPAVRMPEHGSITYRNTARRRHLFIWERLVLVHIQYHKGQEQQGRYKENIRFLPSAVGDLLLTFLAYVQPLRQVFLRQQSPRALLSPFLWAKLDGTIWKDSKASSYIGRACARAEVPRFQIAWWRQVTASITQEKFSARERANFNLDNTASTVEDNEDESDLALLAGMGNHTVQTMHHAYAGTTTLTMTVLLHRAHRASTSWQRLFRVDQVLAGKRPRPNADVSATSTQLTSAHKKARLRSRPTLTEKELLATAREMYGDPNLKFRAPGQRKGILATLGRQSLRSDQVVVILATGSGKTLIFLTGAALSGAGTTILILPTVALRNDMIGKLHKFGIKYHIWAPGSSRSAPLVIMAAEAACTTAFLDYARMLANHQMLDRIVIDECHLTITASDYRESMVQLGWYVGQLKAQTLWLTATLPPVMQDDFCTQNKLVRPDIVRESTNRANIRYIVRVDRQTQWPAMERAASFIRARYTRKELFQSSQDRIIVFCPTKAQVVELATILECPYYVGGNAMADDEKRAAIDRWRDKPGKIPAIVATSALGPGFDYPHVRLVVHVGGPELMTDFSQESGRAGRDEKKAESVILLRATWKPRLGEGLSADGLAMQLYLTQRHCFRGILSQFLDQQQDWRWCMQDEESCGVCRVPQSQARPEGLLFRPSLLDGSRGSDCEEERLFQGPEEVLRQDRVNDALLARYKTDLEIVCGSCLYCRMVGRDFDHTVTSCSWRWDWINAKKKALLACKAGKKSWMPKHAVCWKCYQPQNMCRVGDPEVEDETECVFRDIVIPVCYGKYMQAGSASWFRKHFRRTFTTSEEYMVWLGGKATFGGMGCVQANCVAAVALSELG